MKLERLIPLLILLGACGKVPKEDLAVRSQTVPLEIQGCDAAVFTQGEWPSAAWWEAFEDPQLNHLVTLALSENPSLQGALAKVQEAAQSAKGQRADLFPWLTADMTENWEYFSKQGFVRDFYPTPGTIAVPATTNQVDLTLNFSYELDFFGRNRHRFQAAIDKARAQRAEAAQAQLLIATLVVQTYIELQSKLSQKQVLDEMLCDRKQYFTLTMSRQTEGLDPAMPALDQEGRVYEIEQRLIGLERGIQLDTHMLNMLVGAGPQTVLLSDTLCARFDKQIPLPQQLSIDLLARRPDLMAQLWRVEAAAQEIGAAKADFYPRVNLVAFAGLESLAFSKLLSLSSKQGGLDPAVHLPIFLGGKLQANLKGKVALFNQETYHYNDLILHAAKEVADEMVTTSALSEQLSYQMANLELAETQLALSVSRSEHGLDPFFAVLTKQELLLNQWYTLYDYQRDYLLGVLKLIKALGGGYHVEDRKLAK